MQINHPLVVVSDLHLRTSQDRNYRLFLDVLSRIGPDVKYLVLNGDIFDFCFGWSAYFREKFVEVGQRLEELAAAGVKVIYIQGNHELHLPKLGWRGVLFERKVWSKVTISEKVSVAITHGDVIRAPWHYHLYKWCINTFLMKLVLHLLPQSRLDRWALALARASRGQDHRRVFRPDLMLQKAYQWLQLKGCQHAVVGHFHSACGQKFGNHWVLCVDSWRKPNALTFDGEKFFRIHFSGEGEPLSTQPVIE